MTVICAGTLAFWRGTLALMIGSFMVFANVYVTQPLLPMIAKQFQLTTLQASASVTLTTFTLGMALLVYGPLSDALGRKRIMVITMVGVSLTTLALSFATNYDGLLWLRALQGCFLAGLPAIAIAYLAEEYQPDALMIAVGLYISGNTLGGIGGRLIGGFLGQDLGVSATFAVMSGVSVLCLLLFAVLLPASRHFQAKSVQPQQMLRNMWQHLNNRVLLWAYFIGGFSFFIFINQYSYITFVLEAEPFSLPAQYIGLLFLTYLSGTFGSAISGRLARRWSQPVCMMLGTVILMLGSCVTLWGSLPAIILGLLINSFGFFLTHASCSGWVSRQATFAKASASSLYLTCYYMGASMGSVYLDPFWQWLGWPGVVLASQCILLLVLLAGYRLYQQPCVKVAIV